MDLIKGIVRDFSDKAREERASLFRRNFRIDAATKILDLGSEDGSNIHKILEGTEYERDNVYVADINPELVARGHDRYGFNPVHIPESGELPFESGFFDIVYCSSVVEHATVPKEDVWEISSTAEFKRKAIATQAALAAEITRIGRQYFVQTPCRWFPIESHSWLPFVGYAPRRVLISTLRVTNTVWVKATIPDFNLLSPKEMGRLFPEAEILLERKFGLVKSVMAVKSD